MVEPISKTRRDLLLAQELCTPADLRRARRHVRRLSRDLPAFDSVWLDALVRIGRLTPFQAAILESPDPARIRIGRCLLIDRLGKGPLGQTYLATTGRRHEQCAVKQIAALDRLAADAHERLTDLVANLRGCDHPSVAPPLAVERIGDDLVVISRHVAGPHLADLLVRRGRFPAMVVWEIGRQLAGGLDALQRQGVAHGDLRATNVRLTTQGTAVLVDVGIRAAVDPELSVHSGLPSDRYDGVAPELIGSVSQPTAASDMYALGCLLWQLLAGRPPFPGGDPLIKLAAHQTRTIEDVRKWAPETPAALAEGIGRMTARNPAERPADFREVLERWNAPGRRGRRRLAAFRRMFDAPAPLRLDGAQPARAGRWRYAAVLFVLMVLAAIGLKSQGAQTVILAWRSQWPSPPAEQPAGAIAEAVRTYRPGADDEWAPERVRGEALGILPELPAPDQEGIIQLASPGPYAAREITAVGALTIVGTGQAPATILIRNKPLKLTAESVRLQNVELRRLPGPVGRGPASLALVQAQSLELDHCVVRISDAVDAGDGAVVSTSNGPLAGIGIAWKLVDTRDPQGGTVDIRNTIASGGDVALYLGSPVRRLEIVNCLRLGGGPLCHFAAAFESRRESGVRLDRTTCRATSVLFRFAPVSDAPWRGTIAIEANDCVFDMAPPTGALFEFPAGPALVDRAARVRLAGEGSLASESLVTAVELGAPDNERRPMPPGAVSVEGILAGPYRFSGPISLQAGDSAIRDCEAPRRSADAPGISAAELPRMADNLLRN